MAALVASLQVVEAMDGKEKTLSRTFVRREAAIEQSGHGPRARGASSPGPSPHTHAGYEALLISEQQVNETGLAAFYALDDIVGRQKAEAQGFICWTDGSPNYYDGCSHGDAEIEGDPHLQMTSLLPAHHNDVSLLPDKSIYFGETNFQGLSQSQRIVIPNQEEVNTRDYGYPDKTIELWFDADPFSDDNAHALFTMGTEDTNGLSIFARKHNGSETHTVDLYFYAWTRASPDAPSVQYGTEYINSEPIHCEADYHTDYYLSMVFHTHQHDPNTSFANAGHHSHSPTISAYLRPANTTLCAPNCTVADSLCGKMTRMPHHAVIGRTDGDDGRAVIGGMMLNTRLCGHDSAHCIMANDAAGTHNWRGRIDSVAIYNTALSEAIMQTHVDAAMRD